jgi:hypothetical protein
MGRVSLMGPLTARGRCGLPPGQTVKLVVDPRKLSRAYVVALYR